jgi:hypothetical protein
MGVWGIDNYQPRWCSTSDELSDLLIQASPIGLQIRSVWSLWDGEEDEWFSDAPIVICTQAAQLEFCAHKLDEFSYSLNSIDLGVLVYWCCDSSDTDVQPLYWRKQRNIEFDGLVETAIAGVEIVEYGSIEPDVQVFLGVDTWALTGIALKFDDNRLEILNGLDCNLLSRTQHPWQGLRYTLVESKV